MKKSGTDNTGYKSSVSTWCNSTRLPQMESELLAAHQRTDIEVTSEGIQSNLDIIDIGNRGQIYKGV